MLFLYLSVKSESKAEIGGIDDNSINDKISCWDTDPGNLVLIFKSYIIFIHKGCLIQYSNPLNKYPRWLPMPNLQSSTMPEYKCLASIKRCSV